MQARSQILDLCKVVSVIEFINLVIDFNTCMDTNNLEALGDGQTNQPASIVNVTCCSNQFCHTD